jgi:hypothetical protein
MDGLLSLMNGRAKVGKIHSAKEHIITTFLPINLDRFQMAAVSRSISPARLPALQFAASSLILSAAAQWPEEYASLLFSRPSRLETIKSCSPRRGHHTSIAHVYALLLPIRGAKHSQLPHLGELRLPSKYDCPADLWCVWKTLPRYPTVSAICPLPEAV